MTERPAQWWKDAKFGLFVHWGPYSQAGVEASWPIMEPGEHPQISQPDYEALADTFNPTEFDATAFAELARRAGQRYVVFTSKHHDGYCMFDSAFTDYKITNSPFGRDICAELAAACANAQLPLGFYYSQPDLHHTGYRDTTKPARTNWAGEATRPEWFGYLAYMKAQLTELLTRYGNVTQIWFDGLRSQERFDPFTLNPWLRNTWPGLMLNDRNGGNHSMGAVPGTAGLLLDPSVWGDFATPEQHVPDDLIPNRPWETCMTINDTWAYNPRDTNYKSTGTIIKALVEVVAKGGNLLLNVGPRPDGTIQPEFWERLDGVGAWLRRNGEGIYGTVHTSIARQGWGFTTAKGDDVTYLHVTNWPADGAPLTVEGLDGVITEATVVADRSAAAFERAPGGTLSLTIGTEHRDTDVTVVRVRRA